jgi:hypothetical protein
LLLSARDVFTQMNILSAIFGLILLLFGRRLFWFFVAAAGFAAGMFIARDQLQLQSTWMVFAIALLAGLLGALLSVILQKFAIAIAGFSAGGYLCAFVLTRLNLEKFTWVGFLVGGIVGTILMLAVFEWALVILSSLIGAAFLADGIGTGAKRARRFWSGVCDRPGDPALADASGKKTGSLNAIRCKVITLLPFRQAMSQARGQARIQNLLLGGADVVIEAAEFDGTFVEIVDHVGGFGIAVTGLADTADVYEILFARLDFEFRVGAATDHRVAHERDRDVGVAEKADAGVLVGEAGGGGKFVEDVAPTLRAVERGVDDGEAGDETDVTQFAQPFAIVLGQLLASPVDGFLGVRVEAFKIVLGGTIFVVVAFDDGHAHLAHEVEAFFGIGIVTDHIAQTGVVGAAHGFGVGQDCLKRLPIGVNISYDRVTHLLPTKHSTA